MTEIEIGAPPETVWEALVETSSHRPWYYDLRAEGDFEPGGEVRWLQRDGNAAEISAVREVSAPSRLALDSRFVFTPKLAEQPPHLLTYRVEAAGSGSRVAIDVGGSSQGAAMLERSAGLILSGLRLALDPAAQAEIRRREQIGEIEILDVTPDRLADYQLFFDERAFRDFPAWQFCYCMHTHYDGDATERSPAENRRDMSRMISDGEVTALLAYADREPVAWCNYGFTPRLRGVIRQFKLDPLEQEGVGSVACFVISAPYRRHGIARKLLGAACERLAARGLKWVEAYPAKSGESPQHNYHGPLQMYLDAGFEPVREGERYVVVRKKL